MRRILCRLGFHDFVHYTAGSPEYVEGYCKHCRATHGIGKKRGRYYEGILDARGAKVRRPSRKAKLIFDMIQERSR